MREKILVDKEALRNILLALASDQTEPIEKIRMDRDKFYHGKIKKEPDLVRLFNDFNGRPTPEL